MCVMMWGVDVVFNVGWKDYYEIKKNRALVIIWQGLTSAP